MPFPPESFEPEVLREMRVPVWEDREFEPHVKGKDLKDMDPGIQQVLLGMSVIEQKVDHVREFLVALNHSMRHVEAQAIRDRRTLREELESKKKAKWNWTLIKTILLIAGSVAATHISTKVSKFLFP